MLGRWATAPLGSRNLWAAPPEGGSALLRVRQAARTASATKEGLPSTGRTPVV